jgi:hypothetical protein
LDSNPDLPALIARGVLWAVKIRDEHTLRVLQDSAEEKA